MMSQPHGSVHASQGSGYAKGAEFYGHLFLVSCGLREVPKWARQETYLCLIHKEHQYGMPDPMKLCNQLHEAELSPCFQTSAFAARLNTAEEHEPVRLSNDTRNGSLYVWNEPIFQPFILLNDDLSTSTASLSVCDRAYAAHSADHIHVPRLPWRGHSKLLRNAGT